MPVVFDGGSFWPLIVTLVIVMILTLVAELGKQLVNELHPDPLRISETPCLTLVLLS